jgi:hypothetical protein
MRYKPHCPKADCGGGHEHKLQFIPIAEARAHGVPEERLKNLDPSLRIARCSYCSLIWFQKSPLEGWLGFDPIPIGFDRPEFRPVGKYFRTREENTPEYLNKHKKPFGRR